MTQTTERYPLHEKLIEHKDEAETLSGFLDWLSEQGLWIAEPHKHEGWDDRLVPTRRRNEDLIGGFLDIDPKGLAAEKDAMYQALRRAVAGD